MISTRSQKNGLSAFFDSDLFGFPIEHFHFFKQIRLNRQL
jgi:hypothetical protein